MDSVSRCVKLLEARPVEMMLQALDICLDPVQTSTQGCFKDPIFVALDAGAKNGELEAVGIACLDSRLLISSRAKYSFTTRLLQQQRRKLGWKGVSHYLYGIPEDSPPKDAREALQAIFNQIDHENGGFKNIILVGHDVGNEIQYLRKYLNLDLTKEQQIAATIDTQVLAGQILLSHDAQPSLKSTLRAVGVRTIQLHNSGNDAVYTLKAMIHMFCNYQETIIYQKMLSARSAPGMQVGMVELLWRERLLLLRQIAHCYPATISLQALRRGPYSRPPRVAIPDMLDIKLATDQEDEAEGTLVTIFEEDSQGEKEC